MTCRGLSTPAGLAGLLSLVALAPLWSDDRAGYRLELINVYSPALEGNLLGNDPNRQVAIFLPPSYDSDLNRRYPVLYNLHGNGLMRDVTKVPPRVPVLELLDASYREDGTRGMIVVCPNAVGAHGSSGFVNSTVYGRWADFIAKDLVAYVDANYRTLARPESRGLTGSSMGGRGTLHLTYHYPDVFPVAYAISSGQMDFDVFQVGSKEEWRVLLSSPNTIPEDRRVRRLLGFCLAFSPNPNVPPLYVDLPVRLDGDEVKPVAEVLERWAAFDPIQMVQRDPKPFRQLRKLYFECGTSDHLIGANRKLAELFKRLHVPHVYREFEGGHGNKLAERFRSTILPMFSENLVFE